MPARLLLELYRQRDELSRGFLVFVTYADRVVEIFV